MKLRVQPTATVLLEKGSFVVGSLPFPPTADFERGGLGEIERDLDAGIIKTASWKAPFIIQDSEDAG